MTPGDRGQEPRRQMRLGDITHIHHAHAVIRRAYPERAVTELRHQAEGFAVRDIADRGAEH
ncbi:hypothetical protein ACU8V3_14420 [Cobetia marina]